MASRGGPMVEGTDGGDFTHRERVASQYRISAVNKSRLKTCIFLHFTLFVLMLIKLSPVILDKLDVFILEVEELEMPKPLIWEYLWLLSVPVAIVGLSSIRTNNVSNMQIYRVLTVANAVLPVLYALVHYSSDAFKYLSTRSTKNVQVWKGYPYGLLWYGFLLIAVQIHCFSLYFASNLVSAWQIKSGPKKSN